jgi:crcB protein
MDKVVLLTPLMVALGGAIGSVLRFWCSGLLARAFGETFPWGTLFVNVLGSFLIGLVAVVTGPDGRNLWPPYLRAHVMIGVFGGFTTFSSFSLQTLSLAQEGDWLAAGFNVLVSVVCCLVACWAGHAMGVWINR